MSQKSKVYFIKSIDRLDWVLSQINLSDYYKSGDFVACKIHFGEPGNTAYLKPRNVKPVIEKILKITPNVFLTDCNTIYRGSRADSVNHFKIALKHQYDFAPVIIADGLFGHDFIKVEVNQKHFKEVNLGSSIVEADAMLCLTHFKGHEVTGFGGAIKNLGMGCGARSGKQLMHAEVRPQVNENRCTGCGTCLKWCPEDAITMKGEVAFIDQKKCIGCAECVAACRFGAIAISWAGSPTALQEKMSEHALGVAVDKKDKILYVNYILEVSPNCDCYGHNDPPVVPDIGILVSDDPVAIDQASIDLVNQKAGKDIFREIYPDVDGTVQLNYAEKIGLGQRRYELITG